MEFKGKSLEEINKLCKDQNEKDFANAKSFAEYIINLLNMIEVRQNRIDIMSNIDQRNMYFKQIVDKYEKVKENLSKSEIVATIDLLNRLITTPHLVYVDKNRDIVIESIENLRNL